MREGFTTGSAATGAALAALCLLVQDTKPSSVRVPLPPFDAAGRPRGWLQLDVALCGRGEDARVHGASAELAGPADLADPAAQGARIAHACIIKDGGDDPDVTSGLAIHASVAFRAGPASPAPEIALHGGPGVGRVTLPGLPVPVGQPAINPGPREQLRRGIWLWLAQHGLACPPLDVTISVPGGEEAARKTFNPRLGIEGGISILGTQGTVRPFSHEAFRATIVQGLQVARTMHEDCICLTTGRRSEKLLMALMPELPPRCFVQVADFAQFALQESGSRGFARIVWGCFFGKLLKLAQGLPNTHAHEALTDMGLLADLCREHGMAAECADAIGNATTAAHALELLLPQPAAADVVRVVAGRAASVAARFAGQPVEICLFHTDGRLLCRPSAV